EVAGNLVAGFVAAVELAPDAGECGVEAGEEGLVRESAESGIPHPLVAHGADAAWDGGGIGDAAKDSGDHVAMFKCGGESSSARGVAAEPAEELGDAPLAGVDAAAPVDGLELGGMGGIGDLSGFLPGAVVAPEVVVVDGVELGIDRDDGGAGGVEGDGFDG